MHDDRPPDARWPSAERWVLARPDDDGGLVIDTWTSDTDHRRRRHYEP